MDRIFQPMDRRPNRADALKAVSGWMKQVAARTEHVGSRAHMISIAAEYERTSAALVEANVAAEAKLSAV